MNSFASLKQVEKVTCELDGRLRPVPVFTGSVPVQGGAGVEADAEAGRLVLKPGAYTIAFSLVEKWRSASRVEVMTVLGGDQRFHGPRAVAEVEVGALELIDGLPGDEIKRLA